MSVRNWLYDRGILRAHSLGARTISVGNLTTGGTGKTPLVALTARVLAENGEKVCILTRGYGRANERERVLVSDGETVLADAATGGDEPVELAQKLIGKAVVVADADRVGAAKWAKERFGVTAFVLDDGFQHRRARRDLDIVCIDATNPCGNGRVLPAGTLREPFSELRRADVVVVTRTNLVESTEQLVGRLKKRNSTAPIFGAATRICRFVELEEFNAGRVREVQTLPGRPLAFCGLGNPETFRRQLAIEGLDLVGFRAFDDHHRYAQNDIDRLTREAEELSVEVLITTAKDAVKLIGLKHRVPILIADTEVLMSDGEAFSEMLLSSSRARPSTRQNRER